MSDWDRALPPSDRAEKPDAAPQESAIERVKRICREKGWMYSDPDEDRTPGEEG